MRRVKVSKWRQAKHTDGRAYSEIVFDCLADFHQFGVDYEEFETGAGNYSTAIVELDNGEVKNVPVELVKFIIEGGS